MDVEIKSLLLGISGLTDEEEKKWAPEQAPAPELMFEPPEIQMSGPVYSAGPEAGPEGAEDIVQERLLRSFAVSAAEPAESTDPVYPARSGVYPEIRQDEHRSLPEVFSGGSEGISEVLQQLLQAAERSAEAAETCAASLERREAENNIVYQ